MCNILCGAKIVNIKCAFINYISRVKYGILINMLLLKVSPIGCNVFIN